MLVTGLEVNVDSLSHKCYGKRLISEDTYKCIQQLNLTDCQKTARLMLNVKQTIEQKHEMFEEFVNVLDELGPSCNHFVQELKRRKELLKGELCCLCRPMPACAQKVLNYRPS